jgi:hypothetical protein
MIFYISSVSIWMRLKLYGGFRRIKDDKILCIFNMIIYDWSVFTLLQFNGPSRSILKSIKIHVKKFPKVTFYSAV